VRVADVSFGVRLPVSGPLAGLEAMETVARRAEELHYQSVWVHDHVLWNKSTHEHHISSGSADALKERSDPVFLESLTCLSYLSGLTHRVKLGVACMVMPCRNPVYLAKQAANVDLLSNGRLILGVGLGSKATVLANEFAVFGVPTSKRAERTREYVNAMKTLWTQSPANFSGKYIQFANAEIYPEPIQKPHPPIWIGGWSKGSVQRAAEYGDGWIPGWLTPKEMAQSVAELNELADRNGRGTGTITIAAEKYLSLSKDHEKAVTKALNTIKQSRDTYERVVESLDLAMQAHVFGDPDAVSSKVSSFVEAGVRHFEFKFIYSSIAELLETMELFSDKVMSRFS
jgi:probable F420-dependent oxidoreductase